MSMKHLVETIEQMANEIKELKVKVQALESDMELLELREEMSDMSLDI